MIFSLAITGPTASGKTAISLRLAKRLSGEIISADSMQIYRGMDIGTAKATEKERAEVPHHLIDFLSPDELFSTELYREKALAAAADITERGRLPIFVGGTGLYIDTLMRAPMTKAPESSPEYRERLLASLGEGTSADILWDRLAEIDPESAEKIHKNNLRRVIRALEIYDTAGIKKSELDKMSREAPRDIFVGMITLDFHNRENLYRRIDARVDEMINAGLVAEVSSLYGAGLLPKDSTAAQAIGYKEIISYIEGKTSLCEAIELIKLSSRRYAKRQLTWFRHNEGAYRLYLDGEDGVPYTPERILAEAEYAAEKIIKDFG